MSRDRDRIVARLRKHKTFLDFTAGDLGPDLCRIATDGVQENLTAQRAPDGTPWGKLSDAYGKWKDRKFPGQPMGVLHHLMADPAQVSGLVSTTPDGARVEYGVSQQARAEAAHFSRARPFWGLTASSRAAAKEYLGRRFRAVLRG